MYEVTGYVTSTSGRRPKTLALSWNVLEFSWTTQIKNLKEKWLFMLGVGVFFDGP